MAAAALAFDPQREYSEAEVNEVLKAWLAGAGAMLATDHVELRRWLVDCGLVDARRLRPALRARAGAGAVRRGG